MSKKEEKDNLVDVVEHEEIEETTWIDVTKVLIIGLVMIALFGIGAITSTHIVAFTQGYSQYQKEGSQETVWMKPPQPVIVFQNKQSVEEACYAVD